MTPTANSDPTIWSGTVSDLGQRVKQKYPGQYDDLDDAELGRRVKAKFPGQYDDFKDQSQGANLPPGVGAPPSAPKIPITRVNPVFGKPMAPEEDAMYQQSLDQSDRENAPLGQIGQGVKQMVTGPNWERRAHGASTALRGAMNAGKGAAIALAPMSPIGTAVGLGAGMAAGYGTEKGLESAGVPQGYSELAGDVAGLAAGGMAAHRAGMRVGPVESGPAVDPHVAAIRAWQFNKDPRILDDISNGNIKLTSGLSDLKGPFQQVHSQAQPAGYANESVIQALPQAKNANRAAWQMWMDRAAGQTRTGEPIVRATIDALKGTITDDRAQAILDDAVRNYGKNLSPADLEALLEQKNGELKSFYSQSKEVQGAAERAGADTLKTKALLEAQAKAIRELLYQTLDPEGQGAGPRELQQRYGALKAIEEAANARRTDIHAEHPLNVYERAANIKIDPRAALKSQQGSSEWLIENALGSAPEPAPLPHPTSPYPFNPRQIGPGSIRVGPITPDASFVRGAQGMAHPPNPARALPAPDIVTPPPQDTSFVRSQGAQPPYFGENRQLPPPRPGQPPLNVQPQRSGAPIQMTPSGWPDVNPPMPKGLPAPPMPEGFRVTRHAPAPGEPMPAQHVTAESLARQLGRQIWSALGGTPIR